MDSNLTAGYIMDKEVINRVFVYMITIPSFIGVSVGTLNSILLAYSSRYWKQVRNKARFVDDANYKTATVNFVKFGLSSLIIFLEIILVLYQGLVQVINRFPGNVLEYYHIYTQDYIKLREQFHEPIILILAMVPISIFNMLCLFLIQVIANSNIDFSILHRECKRTFWLCIILIALTTVGNVLVGVDIIVIDIILLYYCWIIYKRMRKLYLALKSKCLDYMYEPKKLRYFNSQVTNFKWSSLLVGVAAGGFVISNAVLTMYESIFRNVIYFLVPQLHITLMVRTRIYSVYMIGYSIFAIIERISFLNWAFVSTVLNCILLFTFIRKAIRYRQLVSQPFHIKLMHDGNGQRLIYKKVNY